MEPTEEEKLIESRLAAGATVQQIADEMGRSYSATLLLIHRLRIPLPPKRGRKISDRQDAEIVRLLDQTYLSQAEIARRVGCSQHTVHCRYKRLAAEGRAEHREEDGYWPMPS